MTEAAVILRRQCTVESADRPPMAMDILVTAPEERPNSVYWINATLSCGSFNEEISAPGDDDFEALTCLLERIADRLLHIAAESGIDIYWRKKGDLQGGAFWGQPLAPWEISVRSRLERDYVAAHPDLPKILTPSVRVAIDDDTGGAQMFHVQPDGSDSLGFTIVPADAAKIDPDQLALMIGRRVLLTSAYGRRVYGEAEQDRGKPAD